MDLLSGAKTQLLTVAEICRTLLLLMGIQRYSILGTMDYITRFRTYN